MKILVTGASGGIGRAICKKFLANGHEVIGMDLAPAAILSTISVRNHTRRSTAFKCSSTVPAFKVRQQKILR